MHPKFEVVRNQDGTYAVKTQLRKGGSWHTAAECFCLPESIMAMGAHEVAAVITKALNIEADRKLAKKLGTHYFNSVGHCEFCGLYHEETKAGEKCPDLQQTAGWVSVLRPKQKTN